MTEAEEIAATIPDRRIEKIARLIDAEDLARLAIDDDEIIRQVVAILWRRRKEL